MQNLTEEEQKIMTSIINDAMLARTGGSFNFQDQGMDNTVKNSVKETKGVFFPSNKKLYETSMH